MANPLADLQKLFNASRQWLRRTPDRAVDLAFQAAVKIKKIEDEFFNGQPISDTAGYAPNTYSLFKRQLAKNLQTIRLRLAAYQLSASLPFTASDSPIKVSQPLLNPYQENPTLIQQLAFIDYILDRYRVQSAPPTPQPVQLLDVALTQAQDNRDRFTLLSPTTKDKKRNQPPPTIAPVEKTIIPGSFFRAFERIRRTVTGAYFGYERDVVDELRQTRQRDRFVIRLISVLVIALVGTQVLTKNLLFSPLIDYWLPPSDREINFNSATADRAFQEYQRARDRSEFQELVDKLNATAPTDQQELNTKRQTDLNQELQSILTTYNRQSLEGLKNLCADITATIVFYLIVISCRPQLGLIKQFIDEILYSLNDSAKAFAIIVATDTFVGFHSSDGWDALLLLIFTHFGLPENPILNKTFIATVPVFLDGLFKFWIFQYLRQSSPSTAVIFNEMNQ